MTFLLGLDFAELTVARSASHIAGREAGAPFGYVVTPNADHLVRISRDRRLRTIYQDAELCLLDSRVVAGISRLFGLLAPRVTPGSDLTAELLAHHLRPNERITIIGLAPVWLPELVARFQLAPPAHHNPPMGFDRDPVSFGAAVAFVREHPARLVFLAVGSPRQEYLAAAIAAAGGATGTGLCIGASLDYLTGACRRAPRLLQRMGLEWLFRLMTDPRRMARRYLIDSPAIIALLLRERLAPDRSGRTLRW
jgi:N-acetylglucosaminyldiphosphoundecaprenol N-acetyl-beta-D-mannosaminyltransferase